MRTPFFAWILALCLAVLLAVTPRTAQADPPPSAPESTAATTATPAVRISTIDGGVRVFGWNRSEVKVTGSAATSVSSDRARVEVRGHSENVEVRVPSGSQVEVRTVGGSITVNDVSGTVRANAVSGDVKVAGTPSVVEAEGVSGSVDLTVGSAEVRARTVSGSLHVQAAGGRVTTRTVSGSAKLGGGSFTRVEMRSVSGSLDFDGAFAKDASLEFHTHSGDIALALPKGAAGNVEVRRGRTRTDVSADAGGRPGGASIVVTTFSGNVSIRER